MRVNHALFLLGLLALLQASLSAVLFAWGAIFHQIAFCLAGGAFGLAALGVNYTHHLIHRRSLELCLQHLRGASRPKPELLTLAATLLASDGRDDEAQLLLERFARDHQREPHS